MKLKPMKIPSNLSVKIEKWPMIFLFILKSIDSVFVSILKMKLRCMKMPSYLSIKRTRPLSNENYIPVVLFVQCIIRIFMKSWFMKVWLI